MATVRVTHTLDDLVSDCLKIASTTQAKMVPVVRRNTNQGNKIAQRFARENAGPHGKAFFKRMTAEMLSPLTGQYGPEGDPKTEFVGVGYRNAGPNTDLPRSADIIGPKFAKDVGSQLDRMFWL